MERRILLTGFPGFIASHLLPLLLRDGCKVYLLVEDRFLNKADEELKKVDGKERAKIVRGDIAEENLGLSKSDLEVLKSEVNEVFHLAAIYNLAVGEGVAHRVNVVGTKRVIDFILSLNLKEFRVFNYVSTCYVSGKRVGVIKEDELIADYGFKNFYESTKHWAEAIVRSYIDVIPTIIYRPAIVVGDSKTGAINKYDGPYYAVHFYLSAPNWMKPLLPSFGFEGIPFNIVPVDFVVSAMAYISREKVKEAIGKTFQLADPYPLSSEELFTLIRKKVIGDKGGWKMPPSILKWFLKIPGMAKRVGIPYQAVPYLSHYAVYDTKNTELILKESGIKCPSPREYIDNIIKFVRENPDIPVVV